MRRALVLTIDGAPPSDNAIRAVGYFFANGKRRTQIVYTTEAQNFEKQAIRQITDSYFVEVQTFVRGHRPQCTYRLSLTFHLPAEDLLNKSWLRTSTKSASGRGASSPYARLDTSNRRKLLQDCVSKACGIDDSLFWEGDDVKVVDMEGRPRTDVVLEETDPTCYGVPQEYLR